MLDLLDEGPEVASGVEIEPLSDEEHARRDALREEMENTEREYFQNDDGLPEEIE